MTLSSASAAEPVISSPKARSTVDGDFTFAVKRSRKLKTTLVRFYVDERLQTTDRKAPFKTTIDSFKLDSGAHKLSVTVITSAKRKRALRTKSITVFAPARPDKVPPSAPIGLTASNITPTGALIKWSASTDNVGVVGYAVKKNGIVSATTTSTSTALSNLACGASYSIVIVAGDAAGNTTSSGTFALSTMPCSGGLDLSAPSAPTNLVLSYVHQTGAHISWTASTDNVGIESYTVNFTNGYKSYSPGTGTSTELTGASCGTTYTISVTAKDTAGNASTSSFTNFTTTTCSPAADTLAPSAPSNLSFSQIQQTQGIASWDASTDNVGVAKYQILVSGSLFSTTISPFPRSNVTGGLCGQSYTIAVRAVDIAGNTSAASSPATLTLSPCSTAASPTPDIAPNSWHTIFQDDFSGTSLNTANWQNQRNDWIVGGATYNGGENALYSPSNVTVGEGVLSLDLKQGSYTTSGFTTPYSTGMINSNNKFSFRYGYIESRVWVPSCTGCWPGFWSLQQSGLWPPEIDFFEFFNTAADKHPRIAYHWLTDGLDAYQTAQYGDGAGADLTGAWHTYGVLWEPGRIQPFVDGIAGNAYLDPINITDKSMYIIYSLQMMKGYVLDQNSTMKVDWIKVWQKN